MINIFETKIVKRFNSFLKVIDDNDEHWIKTSTNKKYHRYWNEK
jgi:hypothetical protein